MVYTLQRAVVEEYDSWKSVFEEQAELRSESGSQGGHLFRAAEDPNEIVVLFEWESEEQAREFIDSHVTEETLEKSRVLSHDVSFMEHVEELEV